MGDGGFFKGTSLEQDSRFSDKQKKLLKSMNFPSEFNLKVDLDKVNLTVIRPWVAQKIVELLGGEDEVVVNYVFGLLEEPDLDPRMMQINLTGFLEKNAPIFVTELWKLLLSAQEGENGIPAIFLEQKMEQIRRKKEEDERILLEIRKRREKEEEERIRLRDIRERERREERERKEREHKPNRHHSSRSRDEDRHSRSSRRRYSRSKSEENRRRHSHRRSKSRSRDRSRDRGREQSRERGRERGREHSRERRRHKSHRHSRSRSKERRRQEERRRRQKTSSRSRDRDDTIKRRRFSREDVITKESIDRVSHLFPEKNIRKDVVTDYDQKKRTVELVEENNSAPSSPPRKKVVDAPIFKSKWNDDEEDEEETVENKKNSISGLEQLEQLRAKAFESMRNRKSITQENDELNLENRDQIVKKLRELLGKENEKYDDDTLIRFAVARNFQLDKAKEQLEETTAWRDSEGIDSIPLPVLNSDTPVLYPIRGLEPFFPDSNVEASNGVPESILRIYEYFGGNAVHKTDKEGRGIYIERLGYHDAKKLAKYIKQEELINWHIRCQEFSHRVVMPELSRRAGKTIDKETLILDCEGMGFHQLHLPGLTLYRAIAELDQKRYPERLGKLFVVNAPFMFVRIWALAKKWLDPGMLKKVHICDKDFQKILLEHIDAENLPSFLGGTCTCSHMSGGCVPSAILNNISPLTRPSLPLTPVSTRSSSPVPPESKKDGFNGRLRILKGDFRSCEVIVASSDEEDIGKNNVEINFRVTEGIGEVSFGVKFIKVDSNIRYDEKIIMPPTILPKDDFIKTHKHTFQTDDTGEFIFTWYFDQWSESNSCVIENSITVNGELYGDQ